MLASLDFALVADRQRGHGLAAELALVALHGVLHELLLLPLVHLGRLVVLLAPLDELRPEEAADHELLAVVGARVLVGVRGKVLLQLWQAGAELLALLLLLQTVVAAYLFFFNRLFICFNILSNFD